MAVRFSHQRRAATISLLAICILTALYSAGCSKKPKETHVAPPPTIAPPMVNPWKEAARKIEEDRGEPIGRKAGVQVPAELEHYSDRRRFLAIQVAEWRSQKYPLPHDYADLVNLIRQGQLVEMEPLGEDYILYGVGANASDEPFQHYDRATTENIPLYASEDDFRKEDEALADSIKQIEARAADLQKEMKKAGKRDPRRATLSAQATEARKAIEESGKRKKLLESFYKNPARRKALLGEYSALAELARDFGGKSYDLNSAEDRRNFKVRLLSFLRPEAKEVLLEIARAYREKYDRHLPITSLVRPEQYQRHLGETNSNATRIAAPPHSTGLAFDIYYYYMTGAEQDYLMGIIAKVEDEGRLEALREKRDHIHVFAFAGGKPPDENLIASSAGQLNAARLSKKEKRETARAKGKSSRQGSKSQMAKAKSGKKSVGSARASRGRGKKTRPMARAGGR